MIPTTKFYSKQLQSSPHPHSVYLTYILILSMPKFPMCCYENKSQISLHMPVDKQNKQNLPMVPFLWSLYVITPESNATALSTNFGVSKTPIKTKHIHSYVLIKELIIDSRCLQTWGIFFPTVMPLRSFHHCEVWMTLAPQSKGALKGCVVIDLPTTCHFCCHHK
jgi:hypothetical protein